MTKNNLGRIFPLSGSGEALFWLSFFPDEIGVGPGLEFDLFLLKHVLMPWTVVAIAMGVGLTGRGLAPSPVSASCLQRPDSIPTDSHTPVTPSPQAGTRTFLLKPPPPEGGSMWGYRDANPPESVKKDRYSPPLRVPVIWNRCTRSLVAPGLRYSARIPAEKPGLSLSCTQPLSRDRFHACSPGLCLW